MGRLKWWCRWRYRNQDKSGVGGEAAVVTRGVGVPELVSDLGR